MKLRSDSVSDNEKCKQAVSAFLRNNINVTVDKWEADKNDPSIAVMQVEGKTVRIRYDKEYDNYIVVNSVVRDAPKGIAPAKPKTQEWKDLDSRHSGSIPTLLVVIGVATLIISLMVSMVSLDFTLLIDGIIACTMFAAAAAIVRELRLTRVQNAHIIRYLEYFDEFHKWERSR